MPRMLTAGRGGSTLCEKFRIYAAASVLFHPPRRGPFKWNDQHGVSV